MSSARLNRHLVRSRLVELITDQIADETVSVQYAFDPRSRRHDTVWLGELDGEIMPAHLRAGPKPYEDRATLSVWIGCAEKYRTHAEAGDRAEILATAVLRAISTYPTLQRTTDPSALDGVFAAKVTRYVGPDPMDTEQPSMAAQLVIEISTRITPWESQ